SLEVKGDLAEKVSGALGIKVEGDVVLESSSQISLKVGGSFVVIHSGGVDIVGPKINLNNGGSPGTPVQTLLPGDLYNLLFHFTNDDGVPYANTKYIAYFADGTQQEGITDDEGKTEQFIRDNEQEIEVQLLI
ncbi:TPA: hypothetical protein O7X39_003814, partial [Salmonella enterica]|nr:hypothetical protein [Salmonella enterica]